MTTSTNVTITIQVNGAPREAPAGASLDAVLRHLGRDPAAPGFAVAVADTIVRRAAWPTTTIQDGDHIEIVTASQGG